MKINKNLPRIALFLQCHLGYKDPSLTHYVHLNPCFRDHPETQKLTSVDEIANAKKVFNATDYAFLKASFSALKNREN